MFVEQVGANVCVCECIWSVNPTIALVERIMVCVCVCVCVCVWTQKHLICL